MEIKRLENDFEKYLFLREYNQKAKMNVPSEYIFECEVYGAFIDGQMLGGFAFAEGEDMAWPQVLPAGEDFFDVVPLNFCLEINLVWAKGPLHASGINMIKLWMAITSYAARVPNIEYITYAVDGNRTSLIKMYQKLALGRIYSGSIPKYPGRSAIVFYTNSFRCKWANLLCIKDIFQKFKRKPLTLKTKINAPKPIQIGSKAS